MVKIALIGEYNSHSSSHQATIAAIEHANKLLGSNVAGTWISTADIDLSLFDKYDGLWIAPGSPYKNIEKTLWAIKYAREHNVPCLGTCGGFQHMIIEYARNVLGYHDAQHAEYDPNASNLFITPLSCSLFGKEMNIEFVSGSNIAAIYGNTNVIENYYCNFGINPDVVKLFQDGPLQIVGSDSEGEIRVIEIPTHSFFVGTLFVPQVRSTLENPHPIIVDFLKAVMKRKITILPEQ
jgi:CTP synthase (UTP-ammonia lyase)